MSEASGFCEVPPHWSGERRVQVTQARVELAAWPRRASPCSSSLQRGRTHEDAGREDQRKEMCQQEVRTWKAALHLVHDTLPPYGGSTTGKETSF